MVEKLNVIELFAGVGGFRIGLEKANKDFFNIHWANQWEPSRKSQEAFECYINHFGESDQHVNEDIAEIPDEKFKTLNADLVVGGFPCQDYSVARSLSGEMGIQGKKGVLFWEIQRVLEQSSPKYVLLENVDRLLKSPSKQRGRDFAVMLGVFRELNYTVEWRVINAAEYGFAQRRRRVFIFAYKNESQYEQSQSQFELKDRVIQEGFFADSFPVEKDLYKNRESEEKLYNDLVEVSDEFSFNFHPAGIMSHGEIYTAHLIPKYIDAIKLKDILQPEAKIDEKYYLTKEAVEKFKYLRGAKKVERTSATGHKYYFSEGGMSSSDSLDKPGRTMLTSEGTKNRSTHIVEVDGRMRYLTPIECERLNGFPDNWTHTMQDRMRYFCMGNALVVGLIEIMGKKIEEIEKNYQFDDSKQKEKQLKLSF